MAASYYMEEKRAGGHRKDAMLAQSGRMGNEIVHLQRVPFGWRLKIRYEVNRTAYVEFLKRKEAFSTGL